MLAALVGGPGRGDVHWVYLENADDEIEVLEGAEWGYRTGEAGIPGAPWHFAGITRWRRDRDAEHVVRVVGPHASNLADNARFPYGREVAVYRPIPVPPPSIVGVLQRATAKADSAVKRYHAARAAMRQRIDNVVKAARG